MRLVFSNPPAMEITGTIKAPEKGDPVHEVIKNRELLQFIRSPLQDDLVSKEIHFTDGRIYQVSLSPVLVDGKPEGRICLLLDISHYEQLNRLKSEFVATVSHYLRAPLSLIHGYASMLAMVGELNEQQDSYVEKILSRTEAMTRLVEELLNLGRIEAGISLDIRQVQPEEILQDVINSFTPLATQKKIGLVLAVAEEQPDGYPPIEVDSTLISQAIHILVENAITYSPMGSQVILSGKVKGEVFTFEVKDFGTGISPVDLEHIFERFFMDGEQAENIQQGKGLGLSIVRSIAVRHKGRVWVESQLGKGSNFYLEVPVRQIT
jgi:signal transduction histidine kinase